MARTVALLALAHGRSGDKGDAVNIGVIARRPEWYPLLRDRLTPERLANFLGSMAKGPIVRYEMPNLDALNFLVNGALGGGGSVSLQLDAQGKTYSHAALRMPCDVTDEVYRQIVEHWGGSLPPECFEAAPVDGSEPYSQQVELKREGRLATITLKAPERHNALSLEMMRQLGDAAVQVAADPQAKVVMLAGEGRSFCAGLDLRHFHEAYDIDGVKRVGGCLADMLLKLIAIPQPVVAAVQGGALGGGMAILLTADVVFAHGRSAKLGLPEVRIGFVPGLVSTLATRRIGAAAAREMMLSGRVLSADEGFRQGWIHRVVDGDERSGVVDAAKAYAAELIEKNSDGAMRRTKRLVNASEKPGLEAEILAARDMLVSSAMEESFRRGLDAFAEKRSVDWSAT